MNLTIMFLVIAGFFITLSIIDHKQEMAKIEHCIENNERKN